MYSAFVEVFSEQREKSMIILLLFSVVVIGAVEQSKEAPPPPTVPVLERATGLVKDAVDNFPPIDNFELKSLLLLAVMLVSALAFCCGLCKTRQMLQKQKLLRMERNKKKSY